MRRWLTMAQILKQLSHGVVGQALQLERREAGPNQFLQGSDERGVLLQIVVAVGPDDDGRELCHAMRQMSQQSQGTFLSPLEIVEDEELRDTVRLPCQQHRQALKEITPGLLWGQFQRRRN